ncbi:MAG: 1-acyl-sn-glycerol-3-phosphate acyltransferase [Sporichthyaceae bacterium]
MLGSKLRHVLRGATARPVDMPTVSRLLHSPQFHESVADLADRTGVARATVRAEVEAALGELAAVHEERVGEFWDGIGDWLVRGYDILIDEDGLAELRRLDRKHSLVFLISHRSYLDEFVLPPALKRGRLSPLFGIAGGNLDFFPLGTLARRNGIVHVRRSTADSPAYRLTLRSFMRQLVAEKANMCWSIEGGRSRTGKLRPPRYGLLRYVADAVDDSPDADPLLIPVSLMYDQLPGHEVARMASEARGQAKEAENLRWLVGYAAGLKERRGRIYVDFGKPLPLRARMDELRAEAVTENLVERIALDVCHRLNAAAPITPTATVCVALLAVDRAMTIDEVLSTIRPLADYVAGRGWPVAGGATLTDRSTVRWALKELTRSGVLSEFSGGPETVWSIESQQHLIAAVYRNSVLHVLLLRAVAELALQAVAEGRSAGPDAVLDEALRLRELLKFEFFFAGRDAFVAEMDSEIEILAESPGAKAAGTTPEQAELWLSKASPILSHLVLRPFLDAYRLVANALVDLGDEPVAEPEDVVTGCLRTGRQWALQRRVASEESVSGEMFRTALKLAGHRGLLAAGPELAVRRREFEIEVHDVGRSIARVAAQAR